MNKSMLVVLNDMPCSEKAVEFLAEAPLSFSEVQITLIHIFRKPTGSEEMMGKKFMEAQKEKIQTAIKGKPPVCFVTVATPQEMPPAKRSHTDLRLTAKRNKRHDNVTKNESISSGIIF